MSSDVEVRRLATQIALDAERTAADRNKMGQFATPPLLAQDITRAALFELQFAGSPRFLEPSVGSGAFFSALHDTKLSLESAVGVELDERFANVARDLWGQAGLDVVCGDFTRWVADTSYRCDLLIANPPYVRHHHLGEAKAWLPAASGRAAGVKVSGLAGLYVHFLLLAHRVLAPGAVSAWLIPSEFLDVNYGQAVKEYLQRRVTLLQIHRFDPADMQFDDALVTSAVVIFRNNPPTDGYRTRFTFGGSVSEPVSETLTDVSGLSAKAKWSRCFSGDDVEDRGVKLGHLFKVQRGIATGKNGFFIRPRTEIEALGVQPHNVTPILPSPRKMQTLTVEADPDGWGLDIPQFGLLGSSLAIDELEQDDPALAQIFNEAPEDVRGTYLSRSRRPWYRQEHREPAPFLCTYMGRGEDEKRPFRFIANRSRSITTNMFLMMHPLPPMRRYLDRSPKHLSIVHEALLAITPEDLKRTGRVYGGGLHKVEPSELKAMPIERLLRMMPGLEPEEIEAQASLF